MMRTTSTLTTVASGDGTSIAFERTGTGPTLVIVDGAMSSMAFGPSEATAAALSGDFRVYRYDRRGRGYSTDGKPYAVAREVEDLTAVISEAGGSAFVYGISSGAGLALEAAASGAPITRLVLFEPPTAEGGDPAQQQEDTRRDGRAPARWTKRRCRGALLQLGGNARRGGGADAELSLWPALEAIAPTIAYDIAAMGDGAVLHEMARRIGIPTLVIAGSLSSEELRHAARTVAQAIPERVTGTSRARPTRRRLRRSRHCSRSSCSIRADRMAEPAPAVVRTADDATFAALLERYRRQLHVHCYRMLGSVEDADDHVQETFLSAWRARGRFEGRASFRTWLYRIATNACLRTLRRGPRRLTVPEISEPVTVDSDWGDPPSEPPPAPEGVTWIGPYPDRMLEPAAPREDEPEELVVARETVELTYMAAIQHLPPRQRAVVILCLHPGLVGE